MMFILDIEASGLGDDSYPIEIAWSSLDSEDSYSTLINPDSAGGWGHWDDYAEAHIHRLSREQCCRDGGNVIAVVEKVEQLLAEYPVFSDAHWQDQQWLNRLFKAVGKRPSAKLMPIEMAVHPSQSGELSHQLANLDRPHRALDDCNLLCTLVRQLRGTR